jgi:excisionase family DNA binding protein
MHQTTPDDPQGAFSIDEFCRRYNLGKTFVYELIKEKKLRAVKCGNRTLILRADAEQWALALPEVGRVGGGPGPL